MYAEMKLRQYACADCGIPCKKHLSKRGAVQEVCKAAAEPAEPWISRVLAASGQRAIRLTLNRSRSVDSRTRSAATRRLIPQVPRPWDSYQH
jgi:hypothetical protein